MKILVAADLHAVTRRLADRPLPSLIEFSAASRSATLDPLLGLRGLFENGKVEVPDLLICAGDLADKADPNAIRSVWRELTQICRDYKVPGLHATCGNHDLDSRNIENKFDPKGFLRALDPPFPLANENRDSLQQLSYWADNFAITEGDDWRLLNINSCAYHGYGDKSSPELEHGRVSDFTLSNIRRALEKIGPDVQKKFNICLFHHHLREISSDSFSDRSKMEGAENLTALLSEAQFGEWLVIHGHRHRAGIYCAGGSTSPFVLSCASFSATSVGDEHNPCQNQFYMVDFEPPRNGKCRIKGGITAWTWVPTYGWREPSNSPAGLPKRSGFGFRGDIHDLVERFEKEVDLAPKFYPVLSSLQRFLVAVVGSVAAGCGAEPFRLRSTASRR
ncbi:hypothetical protein HFO37_12690, partial [Rhizobium leguminosarum]|nr:hypothetical protein [Rhizobium leguminosarum]